MVAACERLPAKDLTGLDSELATVQGIRQACHRCGQLGLGIRWSDCFLLTAQGFDSADDQEYDECDHQEIDRCYKDCTGGPVGDGINVGSLENRLQQ